MKRLYMALVVTLAGCATEPTTSTSEHALKDCIPGGNFTAAKMPNQPPWDGAEPPSPGPKGGFVVWQQAQGEHWNAVIANPSAGEVTWAVTVAPSQIGQFLAKASVHGKINVGRVPPPIGPIGDDWMARYALETQLRVEPVHDQAMPASALN